jgi:multidrug efflux system outer membrane protein
MRRLLLLLALVAVLPGGCIDLAPAYHRPASPTPAQFPTGPAYSPAPAAAQPTVGWRGFFSDPKLKAVIEAALANNRDLRVAVANVAAARAQYHVQRAALFPAISAQAAATYGQEPASVVTGLSGAHGVYNEKLFSLTAGVSSYQLDLFGKVRDLTRAAQDRYFATREARDAAQITLVQEVAVEYLAVGSDRALLQIAQDTLKSATASLEVTTQRLRAGVDSELDVSQAQTVVQQARFDVADRGRPGPERS